MRQLMQEQLPAATCELLNRVAVLAGNANMPVYVVGGFVRDLLLNIENLDIDLVVEGDGLGFARQLAVELNAEVTPYTKFGTSVLHFKDGSHMDVATARREIYKEPAALPTVRPGAIREDMDRRDFTINSLAIKLEPDGSRALLDFIHGKPDLDQKIIRILHAGSFLDDPTRIFRAIRFEQRLGFQLDPETERQLVEGIPTIEKLSGHRLLNELAAIFEEKRVLPCLRRLQELGVQRMIEPELYLNEKDQANLDRLQEELDKKENRLSIGEADPVSIWLLGMLWSLDKNHFIKALDRLDLKGRTGEKLHQDQEQCRRVLKHFEGTGDSSAEEIYNVFSAGSIESSYWLMAVSDNERVRFGMERFYSYLKQAGELSLTGDDLIRMGLKPGPLFQEIFGELRRARLEGKIHSREGEESRVREKFLASG